MIRSLKQVLALLTPAEKRTAVTLSLLDVFTSLLDVFFLALLLLVVDLYTQATYAGRFAAFAHAFTGPHATTAIILFLLFFALKSYGGFWVTGAQYRFVYGVSARISAEKLAAYLAADYNYYASVDSSVHIHRIDQQTMEFGHYVLSGVQQIISQLLLLVLTITAICCFSAQLFLLLLIVILPPIALAGFVMKKRMHRVRTHVRSTFEKNIQHLREALTGFVESNIYNRHAFFTGRYAGSRQAMNGHLAEQQAIQHMPPRLIEVFAVLGLFALIGVNVVMGHGAQLPVVLIGAFMGAAYKIIPGIVKILNSVGQVRTYAYTIAGLQHEPAVVPVRNGLIAPAIVSLQWNDVTYQYAEGAVMRHQDGLLRSGDFMALSGRSGKGKTTLLHLLMGFLAPASGTIRVNGLDMLPADRRLYLPRVAYVKQQPFFIHDTLLKNILLSDEEPAEADKQHLYEILAITGLDALIAAHPKGWHMPVSENGRNLSGGQRQRLAFARALYRPFDLLVLDEPFSELDRAAEHQCLTHLRTLAQQGKIVLLVSHNKDSFAYCNKSTSLDAIGS